MANMYTTMAFMLFLLLVALRGHVHCVLLQGAYTRLMRHTLDHAEYIRDQLLKGGKFQIMNDTQRIPVVALTLDKSIKKYNEFD